MTEAAAQSESVIARRSGAIVQADCFAADGRGSRRARATPVRFALRSPRFMSIVHVGTAHTEKAVHHPAITRIWCIPPLVEGPSSHVTSRRTFELSRPKTFRANSAPEDERSLSAALPAVLMPPTREWTRGYTGPCPASAWRKTDSCSILTTSPVSSFASHPRDPWRSSFRVPVAP